MTLKHRFYALILTFLCLNLAQLTLAQDKDTNPKTEAATGSLTEEIDVVRPYKPVLANASKIRRNPDLNETPVFKPLLNYNILDKRLESNTDIKQLQYQQVAASQVQQLFNNYAKIGAGNLKTGLGELYLNTGRNENLQAGLYAKYFSQQGELNKQEFSDQQFGVFGKYAAPKFSLSGQAGYKGLGTYFYAYDPVALPNTDPAKQHLSLIDLSAEISSNFKENPEEFTYALKINAGLFKNELNGSENNIAISGLTGKKIGEFYFGLNSSLDLSKVKDQSTLSNNLFKVNPYAKYEWQDFKFNLGLNIVQESGITSRFKALPVVNAEYTLSPEYAILFAGLSADIKKTSLSDLSFENPYLNQGINIKNTFEKSSIYFGIKGNAGAALGFRAMAWMKSMEDFALFVNNTLDPSRFDVIYDDGQSKQTGIEGEINIKASKIIDIHGKVQSITYNLASEEKAWFKPNLRLESEASAHINQKISLSAGLVFNGASYAKDSGGQAIRIKSFMNLNAGASYQVKKQFGVYIQANNILANENPQYLYYPRLGMNVFGGLNYRF